MPHFLCSIVQLVTYSSQSRSYSMAVGVQLNVGGGGSGLVYFTLNNSSTARLAARVDASFFLSPNHLHSKYVIPLNKGHLWNIFLSLPSANQVWFTLGIKKPIRKTGFGVSKQWTVAEWGSSPSSMRRFNGGLLSQSDGNGWNYEITMDQLNLAWFLLNFCTFFVLGW